MIGDITLKNYRLDPYNTIFGSDFAERINRIDGRQYHFEYNSQTKELDLFNSEE